MLTDERLDERRHPMPTDTPTAEDVAFAKRWASMQTPPVTLKPKRVRYMKKDLDGWEWRDVLTAENLPKCLFDWAGYYESEERFFATVVNALKPFRRSLAPVIIAEEREKIAKIVSGHNCAEQCDIDINGGGGCAGAR
jgi:hypothetical protein